MGHKFPKVLGLYNIRDDEWRKLAYLHSNSAGRSCVDGQIAEIVVCAAGTEPQNGDFAVIVPQVKAILDAHYLSVNSGECLMKVRKQGDRILLSVVNSGFAEVSADFEVWREMRVGVLTVSDKGSRGERIDTAGPVLADLVTAMGADVECRDMVPDDRETIAATIKKWSDELELNLVLTTGGTGLSVRDVTPEAIGDVAERDVPGFGEMMRSRSLLYTERGFLTRGLAVTRKKTLIIAFPGSERAVRQCFEAIAPGLRHGVEILAGWDAECGGHDHHK